MAILKTRGGDYTDAKPTRRLKREKAAPKAGPRATAWEKMRSRGLAESSEYRDVHGEQQLERGEIGKMRTKTLPVTVAVITGLLVLVLTWLVIGLGGYAYNMVSGGFSNNEQRAQMRASVELGVPQYWLQTEQRIGTSAMMRQCFVGLDQAGEVVDEQCYREGTEVPRPQWHIDATDEAMAAAGITTDDLMAAESLNAWLGFGHISTMRLVATLGLALLTSLGVYTWGMRKLAAANLMTDVSDINQGDGDQHIALVEEVFERYSVFPDVGAHAWNEPSSLIGHAMLSNDGVRKIKIAKRHQTDVLDEHGEVLHYKGEPIRQASGELVYETVPMFDEAFGHDLYDKSGLPRAKGYRKFFSPRRVPYNPGGKDRDKTGEHETIADLVNTDWVLPDYEPQRPAGVYFIDEAPVNTMVLAMTRAGKGQTYIEPMIDMWLRERRPNNLVINDPKGELLVKHYVRATVRGFQVVQFNLIDVLKTDIYNPLAMAAEAARRGDQVKVSAYVEAIAEVFFPIAGEDPFWPTAAANAFKRTAYGMIDYYMEEERQMRKRAQAENWDLQVLESRVDEAWGKVTLYNCYQLFVQLSSKKVKDPVTVLADEIKAGKYGDVDEDPEAAQVVEELLKEAQAKQPLWGGEAELDMLTLFFNATDMLPLNQMRTEVSNADKSLRAMGGSDKTIASVYGIAITAMAFFTDPTISTLTSGALSQNVDLAGLSFPRRFGVRFNPNYIKKLSLVGTRVIWESYHDPGFTDKMGKDFEHADVFTQEGWAKASLEGKFPGEVAYLKMQIVSTEHGTLIDTFYFKFIKGYRTNLSGRTYVKDPVLGTKIVKDGLFLEMIEDPDNPGRFIEGNRTFEQEQLNISDLTDEQINSGDTDLIKKVPGRSRAIISLQAHYSEQPKMIFLVTPPHLMKYAKLILILIKQLVDLNFDSSYKTKPDQKPLYKTRYMLDELGNLQSDGHGIAGFETMLSIGLGQGQEFTLILQTLQQLRDVYGDSVDKIVQGNAANLVFLKSTDDSMIDTLTKMSGTTHKVFRSSKTITQDVAKVALQTEGKVSFQMQREERPVITYNDLAYLPARNSIVFSAGVPPIWNRNETILPMSFALFGGSAEKTIVNPGHKYSLQTIPTLSTAKDFDVRRNQPNFFLMVEKRIRQAMQAPAAEALFRKAYGYGDFEISRLDPDVMSTEIMDINDVLVSRKLYDQEQTDSQSQAGQGASSEIYDDDPGIAPPPDPQDSPMTMDMDSFEREEELLTRGAERLVAGSSENTEAVSARAEYEAQVDQAEVLRYAEGTISREMLIEPGSGKAVVQLDHILAQAYDKCHRKFDTDRRFALDSDGSLRHRRTGKVMVQVLDPGAGMAEMAEAAQDAGSRVHMDTEPDPDSFSALSQYRIHDEFKRELVALEHWRDLAEGAFDAEVAELMRYAQDA